MFDFGYLRKTRINYAIFSCYAEGGGSDEEHESEASDSDSEESDEMNNEFSTMLAVVKNSGI